MVSPPCPCLGAALRYALSCFPSRSRPTPKRGAARPAPVLLRAVLPPCKASQETAGGLSGVKASALRCAPAGGAWARAGVTSRRWTRPHRGLRVQGKRRTLVPGGAGVGWRIPWGLGTPRPLPGRSGLLFDWSFTAGLCAAGHQWRAGAPSPQHQPWCRGTNSCGRPLAALKQRCPLLRRFFLLGRPRNVIAGRSCVKARPRGARCFAPASLRSLDTRARRLGYAA